MTLNYKSLVLVLFCFVSILFVQYARTRRKINTEPQVEGWGFSAISNLNHYINKSCRFTPNNFCIHKPFLVVMIHSKPTNTAARNSIRKSWGKPSHTSATNVSLVFLLGKTPKNLYLQQSIEDEGEEFGDILQEEFTDSYNNLTLKSIMMLKLATFHCQQSKYLLKTDDDTLVNLDNVVQMLIRDGSRDLLMGHLFCEAVPDRNPSSKWFAPYCLYPESRYPNYLSGGGYLMSMDVARELYRVVPKTPLYHLEDVYVTGMCAKKAGITPQHNIFYSKRRKLAPCLLKEMLAVFDVDVDDMLKLYSVTKDDFWGAECNKTELFSSVKWIFDNIFTVRNTPFGYRKLCN